MKTLIALLMILAGIAQADASCHVAGDSIAFGTAQVLRGCTSNAKVGIPSSAIIARVPSKAKFTIVSAGSNDPTNPSLSANLERIRSMASGQVIWILPAVPAARAKVQAIVAKYHDRSCGYAAGGDGVHPRSYQTLASCVLGQMK